MDAGCNAPYKSTLANIAVRTRNFKALYTPFICLIGCVSALHCIRSCADVHTVSGGPGKQGCQSKVRGR